MSVDITSLVMDKYHINKKQEEIAWLNKEIEELQKGLERKCTHPTIITTSQYFEGGYYDKSNVVITKTCSLCGKIVTSYDDPNHQGSFA